MGSPSASFGEFDIEMDHVVICHQLFIHYGVYLGVRYHGDTSYENARDAIIQLKLWGGPWQHE